MTAMQLTFEGGEETMEAVAASARSRISAAQRAILVHIDHFGEIRPIDAGLIAHADRKARGAGGCGVGARVLKTDRSKGCCAYCSSDGAAALKRLLDRGVVVRLGRGRYARP